MVSDRPRGGPAGGQGVLARYTPDGALGRILLALLVAPVAAGSFWFAIVGLAAPGLLTTILGLFYAGLTVGGTVLALLLLWPVYLSLIGELESTAEYGSRTRDADAERRDALAALKREYAAGELSEREFERRLERLLGVEAVEASRTDGDVARTDHVPERDSRRQSRREEREVEESLHSIDG